MVLGVMVFSPGAAWSQKDAFSPPELQKLKALEEEFRKERDRLVREFQEKEKIASGEANKAREEWVDALRKRDKEAEKKAKDSLEAAEKKLNHIRVTRFELSKARFLGFVAPAPPPPKAEEKLGLRLGKVGEALSSQLGLDRNQGLIVEKVGPGSAAEKAGLKTHDVLVKWNGKTIPGELADFRKLAAEEKAPAELLVIRKGKEQVIPGLVVPPGPDASPKAAPGKEPPKEEKGKIR